ncbi:MAG: phosphoserine phosphatase SerB [Deltaproteobacteria bacterium]|nr:phosphoserine phosphatase SerB [Deltaproteobacteria bacterium]
MSCLLTFTGLDNPGITSAITKKLDEAQINLEDIEQVVVRGQLILCLLVDLDPKSASHTKILQDLKSCAAKLNQEMSHREVSKVPQENHKRRYVLTIMAEPVTADVMHLVSNLLATHQANIDSIRRLSHGSLASLEIALSIEESSAAPLKQALLQELIEHSVDIALQRESLTRRNKRLIVLDMDSTLIQNEVIDEMARLHGVYDEVSKITHQAMSEGLDFKESFKKRVALLKGLEIERVEAMVRNLKLTPGARELVRVLKRLGYEMGIVSGGLDKAAQHMKESLGLDFAYANQLESKDGKLTGEVLMPIVDAQRKADLLEIVAQSKNIPLEQTIAIGDGANDACFLAKAGLGIAYHAKPILKRAADTSISSGGLERILYLLGIHARDIHEFL